jgi:membrane-bound lytic murein transglycosylase B
MRVAALFASLLLVSAPAAAETFPQFLTQLEAQAVKTGLPRDFVSMQLQGLEPHQRIIELDRQQAGPGTRAPWPVYRDRVITKARINKGRALMAEHSALLHKIGRHYGVPPQYIVALWGLETSYGANTGGFDVVQALATLAWEGRRREMFTDETLNALKILYEGHIPRKSFKGSWAGAMGQCQFMPSSFFKFAQDWTGDGHKDIWTAKADVFASTANYLHTEGWEDNIRWGRRVKLTKPVPSSMIGLESRATLATWANYGVIGANGAALPLENIEASLLAPDGLDGEIFLVYMNFRTIMKWNRSTNFALSVGHLADHIASGR